MQWLGTSEINCPTTHLQFPTSLSHCLMCAEELGDESVALLLRQSGTHRRKSKSAGECRMYVYACLREGGERSVGVFCNGPYPMYRLHTRTHTWMGVSFKKRACLGHAVNLTFLCSS